MSNEQKAAHANPRVAVVGHVEWVQFARVEHVPRAGEVVHARDAFEEPAGGGAVAAVQLARLAGDGAFPHGAGRGRSRPALANAARRARRARSCRHA